MRLVGAQHSGVESALLFLEAHCDGLLQTIGVYLKHAVGLAGFGRRLDLPIIHEAGHEIYLLDIARYFEALDDVRRDEFEVHHRADGKREPSANGALDGGIIFETLVWLAVFERERALSALNRIVRSSSGDAASSAVGIPDDTNDMVRKKMILDAQVIVRSVL
ncbi:hypothetical protein B9J07_21890 [Sinorhizobium sp. LM21]|nr:hypothetical protein B9J07_21890 [Sinorhizobium sp. LM21]